MTNTPEPIASNRHTTILASAFLLIAIVGGYAQYTGVIRNAAPTEHQTIRLYVSVLIFEWASVFYVWKGMRKHGRRVRDLVGGSWRHGVDFARDIALAAAIWAVWIGIQSFLPGTNQPASTLLPQTGLESAVWILVAVSAGICEEVVFRGYFQTQFHARTRSLPAAIVLQAVLFGVGHFWEGSWAVIKIALYGGLFGMLAAWRRSLRPGVIAHTWSDLFGLVMFR